MKANFNKCSQVCDRYFNFTAILLIGISFFGCGDTNPLQDITEIDIAILNGEIIDGTGSEPYIGNIYINGDEIIHIDTKPLPHPNIKKTIDAGGRVVTPGFIDLHAHGNPLSTPAFKNFLAMGVTTISLGQDGSSPPYEDLSEWLDSVQQIGIGTNLAMMVGHGTLRNLSGIGMKQDPDTAALNKMMNLLEQNLDVCFGLSTGLEYVPGMYASQGELDALAKVVGKSDRIIMSHMRNEDDEALESSINELIDQGKYCKVHIAHLKSVYGKGEARAEEILDILYDARDNGISITADMYPYNASYTGISILFPDWAKTQGQFKEAKKNRRKELEKYLRQKVESRNGPEATLLGSAPFTGKTLADLEKEYNLPYEDILIDVTGPQGSSGAYFVMDESLQTRLLKDTLISVCSDGSPTGFHPRGHGTFAKIIEKYVVADSILTLVEAIHKMTGYATEIMDIKDRGQLQKGMKADLAIFDPRQVKSPADYASPHQLAKGFEYVIVNGNIAKENNDFNPGLHGKVLKPDN